MSALQLRSHATLDPHHDQLQRHRRFSRLLHFAVRIFTFNVWLGPATKEGEDPLFVLVIVQDEIKFRLDHFGFQCDSREEVVRIAEHARGQNILVEPPADLGGIVGYFTTVRDPDGHVVEFTFGQPLKGLS